MQNAEHLLPIQIGEFLKASEGIDFGGTSRAEVYGWIQRTLIQLRTEDCCPSLRCWIMLDKLGFQALVEELISLKPLFCFLFFTFLGSFPKSVVVLEAL
jgi:hypothetical protein